MHHQTYSQPGTQPIPGTQKVNSINRKRSLVGRFGILPCGTLLGVLAGCTTYVEQPRHAELYPPPPAVYAAPPAVEVSFAIRTESDFYEPLTPYGRWEVVGSYGRCWIPGRVEADWRPYSNGHWQRTDAGWYWASEEPWGWATYHYGRWDFTAQFGWYWVPQTQWAPAWVSWHEGGGYVGWAPLLPSVRIAGGGVTVNVGLIAPRAYVFVEQRRFLEPIRPATVVVNNTTIINNTVNITNIKVVNNTVINEGPRTTVIEQASGQKVQAVPVRELRRNQEAAVVARQRTTTPLVEKQALPPVRTEAPPRETKAQSDGQRRAKEAEALAQERLQRNAQDSKRATQGESKRQGNEAAAKASENSQRKARGQEKKAQQESEQQAQDAAVKARAESQRNANEQQQKVQRDSERRAQDAAVQAQENSQRNARGQEKKAQQQSEQRAKDATVKARGKPQRNTSEREQKPPRVSEQPANQGPDPIEKGSARLLKKDNRKKNKAPEPPKEE